MGKNKILIVGKRPWQIVIIENALKKIFKREPKFYLEHIETRDALLDLCVNQDELCCIFCFHSNDIDGIQFFKEYKQSARVKSIPFVLILKEQFRNIIKQVENKGIVCVEFKNVIDNIENLAKKIVKAMVESRKR